MVAQYLAGVSLSVTGSTVLNLGHNLMKRDHMRNASLPPSERRFYLRRWRWVAGFLVFALGNVFDFVALGLVAQSVIAPLGAVSIVTNVGFATRFLGERFTRRDALGTALVIAGAILCVVFGSHEDTEYTLPELGALVRGNTALWVFWAACGVVVVALGALVPLVSCAVRGTRFTGPTGPGAFIRRHVRLQPMLHTTIGGVVGAQTIIGAKILSELMQGLAKDGASPFGNGYFYLVLALTGLSGITQVHQFQVALRQADALIVVPSFFVVWTLLSVTSGGIFFREFDHFSAGSAVAFALGVAVTTLGVVILASRLRIEDVVNDIAPGTARPNNDDDDQHGEHDFENGHDCEDVINLSSGRSGSAAPRLLGDAGGVDTAGIDVDVDVDVVSVGAAADSARWREGSSNANRHGSNNDSSRGGGSRLSTSHSSSSRSSSSLSPTKASGRADHLAVGLLSEDTN